MKVVLAYDTHLPATTYGGTERVVWWLAKGLSELGVEVLLACKKGSQCPYAELAYPDFSRPLESYTS